MTESFASPEGFEPLRPREETASVASTAAYPAPADYGALFDDGLRLLRNRLVSFGVMAGALVLLASFTIALLFELVPPAGFLSFVAFLASVALVVACSNVLTGWAARSWFAGEGRSAFDVKRFLNTFAAALVVGVLSTLAATPIVPLGMRILYRTGYATTATAQEGLGPFAAISRSWRMTAKSDRFGVWFGLTFACAMLALLPSSFALAVAREEYAAALGELLGMDLGSAVTILRPIGLFLMGLGLAVPAVVLGRFQVDLVVRQQGVDLRERLAEAFPSSE